MASLWAEEWHDTICMGCCLRLLCSKGRRDWPITRPQKASRPEKMVVACNKEEIRSGEMNLGSGSVLTVGVSGPLMDWKWDMTERRHIRISLNFGLSKRDGEAMIRANLEEAGKIWRFFQPPPSVRNPAPPFPPPPSFLSFLPSLHPSFIPSTPLPPYFLPSMCIYNRQTLYFEINRHNISSPANRMWITEQGSEGELKAGEKKKKKAGDLFHSIPHLL